MTCKDAINSDNNKSRKPDNLPRGRATIPKDALV